MTRRFLLSMLSGLSIIVVATQFSFAGKAPEPSVFPLKNCFYLTFKHAMPKRIVVDVPGQKTPTAYWYLTYTVTNDTGREQDFFPDFEMVTQDGKVRRSDQNIPLPVFESIKKSEGNDLLQRGADISGPLHQGEDQARDGVAIWEEPMARMGSFEIYVGNLNNEFVTATDDKGQTLKDAEGLPIILHKTLMLQYTIWGDEVKPELDEVHAKPDKWVMR